MGRSYIYKCGKGVDERCLIGYMIEQTVNIRPISVNECWQGRRFKTKLYADYERSVLLLLPKPERIYEGNLEVEIVFYFKHPKKRDVDNGVKPALDLLQKRGYFKNDNQIVSLIARKEQSDEEGWRFRICKI